jgi:uncharacterized protein YraI
VNLTKEKLMSTLKATFGGVVVLIATLTMIAFAQAQSKSSPVTSLEEAEAIYVGKNGTVHKSNTKVSAEKHEAALKRGAVELSRPTVMYHQGCCGRHQRGRGFPRPVRRELLG